MRFAFVMLALGWSGCSNTAAVKLAEDSAAEVCACKDNKCARDAIVRYEAAFKKDFANAKGTPGDVEKIQAAGKKLAECFQKLEAPPPQ
jgi:hypothetical protein